MLVILGWAVTSRDIALPKLEVSHLLLLLSLTASPVDPEKLY